MNNTKLIMSGFPSLDTFSSINGSEPLNFSSDNPLTGGFYEWDLPTPHTPFPFLRLASSTAPGDISYLYHQVDNFTLIEHELNGNVAGWTSSTNITIPS